MNTADQFNQSMHALFGQIAAGASATAVPPSPAKLSKPAAPAYKTSLIKRTRRSAADLEVIRNAMYAALVDDRPMTVRQMFYRLVSDGVIEKSENEYKNTVCRLLTEMRLAREIPFDWIADHTRWQRKSPSYSSIQAALRNTRDTYRRAVWNNQPYRVEVWLEKDALASVLVEETDPWDVPLMVTRGYPSVSYLHGAAVQMASWGKPALVYYFGDHDPSGVDISRNVEARLREFAPDTPIYFERVAVNPEQIESMGLITRPTKTSDSRSKNFAGESVEVDAIPARQLRAMARECILNCIDEDALTELRVAEQSEREVFEQLVGSLEEAA